MKKMRTTRKKSKVNRSRYSSAKSQKRHTNRFFGPGGYVDQVLGDGDYAVQYSVCDSTGHLLKKKVPGSGDFCSVGRVKRFKTLNGAISFFFTKRQALPCIFVWKNRKATASSQPTGRDDWGFLYDGGVKKFTENDLGNFFRKYGGDPYFGGDYSKDMLIAAVKRKLLIK